MKTIIEKWEGKEYRRKDKQEFAELVFNIIEHARVVLYVHLEPEKAEFSYIEQ